MKLDIIKKLNDPNKFGWSLAVGIFAQECAHKYYDLTIPMSEIRRNKEHVEANKLFKSNNWYTSNWTNFIKYLSLFFL